MLCLHSLCNYDFTSTKYLEMYNNVQFNLHDAQFLELASTQFDFVN